MIVSPLMASVLWRHSMCFSINMATISRTLTQSYVTGFKMTCCLFFPRFAASQIIPLFIPKELSPGTCTELVIWEYNPPSDPPPPPHVYILRSERTGLFYSKMNSIIWLRACLCSSLTSLFVLPIGPWVSQRQLLGCGWGAAQHSLERTWLPFAKRTVCSEQEMAHLCPRMALI